MVIVDGTLAVPVRLAARRDGRALVRFAAYVEWPTPRPRARLLPTRSACSALTPTSCLAPRIAQTHSGRVAHPAVRLAARLGDRLLAVSPPSVADTTAEGQAAAFSLNVSDDGDDSDRIDDDDCGRPARRLRSAGCAARRPLPRSPRRLCWASDRECVATADAAPEGKIASGKMLHEARGRISRMPGTWAATIPRYASPAPL